MHVTVRNIGTSAPTNRKLEQYLSRPESSAEDRLARLREANGLALQPAFLACGIYRIEVPETLQDVLETGRKELARTLKAAL